MRKFLSILLFSILIAASAAAYSKEPLEVLHPWSIEKSAPVISLDKKTPKPNPYAVKSSLSVPFLWMITFYKLTSTSQQTCTFVPSCSEYSRQAIIKHGFFLGLIMTAERIMRFHNDIRGYKLVETKNGLRLYDPLKLNDFWF